MKQHRRRCPGLLTTLVLVLGYCAAAVAGVATHITPATYLGLREVWASGLTGANTTVGVCDTGVAPGHSAFRRPAPQPRLAVGGAMLRPGATNIAQCHGYTTQRTCADGFGHGTFVAGTVASQEPKCPGVAPDAELHVFKVFTDTTVSYTAWFVKALRYLVEASLDVVNLSIGGPDFADRPFTDRIREVSAAGTTVVAAIGNDGPGFGSGLAPGDLPDVVAVGAHTAEGFLAPFSARGMTTPDLPRGYGLPKPDLIAVGESLTGPSHRGVCKTLSGTSVAAPVVTGVVSLMVTALRRGEPRSSFPSMPAYPSPGLVKHILLATARPMHVPCRPCRDIFADPTQGLDLGYAGRHHHAHLDLMLQNSVYAQGAGALDAVKAIELATEVGHWVARHGQGRPPAGPSLHPGSLHLAGDTPCRRWWPHCDGALYHTGRPVVVNLTVLSPWSVAGRVLQRRQQVQWDGDRDVLSVTAVVGDAGVFPWAGTLGVRLVVQRHVTRPLRLRGTLSVPFEPFDDLWSAGPQPQRPAPGAVTWLRLPFSVDVIPTPPPARRVLWDVGHQLLYPPHFVPRDDLSVTGDMFDSRGDHPHLNMRHAFHALRRSGYHVEITSSALVAPGSVRVRAEADAEHQAYSGVDLDLYGALLLVDPEEHFFAEEVAYVTEAVTRRGLGLVVVSDWHDPTLMAERVPFMDDNVAETQVPVVGGANAPALNALLRPFGLGLAQTVVSGSVRFQGQRGPEHGRVKSGGWVATAPPSATVCTSALRLADESADRLGRRPRTALPTDAPLVAFVDVAKVAPDTAALRRWLPALHSGRTGPGRVAAFGDSGCLEASGTEACLPLFLTMVAFATKARAQPELTTASESPLRGSEQCRVLGGTLARWVGTGGYSAAPDLRATVVPFAEAASDSTALARFAASDPLRRASVVITANFSAATAAAAGLLLGARMPKHAPSWDTSARAAPARSGPMISRGAPPAHPTGIVGHPPRLHAAWLAPAALLVAAAVVALRLDRTLVLLWARRRRH